MGVGVDGSGSNGSGSDGSGSDKGMDKKCQKNGSRLERKQKSGPKIKLRLISRNCLLLKFH